MAMDDRGIRASAEHVAPTRLLVSVSESASAKLDENAIRLLLIAFRVSERYLLDRTAQHGYSDIRMTHFPILRSMSRGLGRMTEIADMAGVTKQTAGVLAAELEVMGYVGRRPDPHDGRAKIVQFTGRGRALMKALPRILDETENQIVGAIGADDLEKLMSILTKLAINSGEVPGAIAP
jgi:DNA-binding MarR family transcriptional regulator